MKKVWTWLEHAPSVVWVFLIPTLFFCLIATTIGLFWALANLEGFASIIFVVIGWLMAVGFSNEAVKAEKTPAFLVGAAICFYALMGMAVDQPGNLLFNKPVEWVYCPTGATLYRGVTVSHPLPERTDITQDFRCVNEHGTTLTQPNMLGVIAIRFVEYAALVYFFMAVLSLKKHLFPQRHVHQPTT